MIFVFIVLERQYNWLIFIILRIIFSVYVSVVLVIGIVICKRILLTDFNDLSIIDSKSEVNWKNEGTDEN
mgnify:CR=1 FL=1